MHPTQAARWRPRNVDAHAKPWPAVVWHQVPKGLREGHASGPADLARDRLPDQEHRLESLFQRGNRSGIGDLHHPT